MHDRRQLSSVFQDRRLGSSNKVSVVIPNWNGARLLERCIDSVFAAMDAHLGRQACEIIVADDGSSDVSLSILETRYPTVHRSRAHERAGFIAAANRGLARCTGDYVLLLNNDVILYADYFRDWQNPFADPAVFAVTGRMLRPDGVTYDSGRDGVWDHGLLRHWVVCNEGTTGPTLFGTGGATIYYLNKFRSLGCLDTLYRPMCVEDFDVGYRAWKRGWKTLYRPDVVAVHHGSVSSKKVFRTRELERLVARNHYLFVWKNVTDPRLTRRHLLSLLPWVAQSWRGGHRVESLGLVQALPRLPEALQRRAVEVAEERVGDGDIWRIVQPTGEDLRHSPYAGQVGTA